MSPAEKLANHAALARFDQAPSWPVDPDEIRSRLTDRLAARLPFISRTLGERFLGSPAGSPLRRWFLTRVLTAGWAALDREDYDYLESYYSPAIQVRHVGDPIFDLRDADGWRETLDTLKSFREVFSQTYFRVEEITDFGGPFFAARLALGATGRISGLTLPSAFKVVGLYEFEKGVVRRQWHAGDEARIEEALASRLAGPGLTGS